MCEGMKRGALVSLLIDLFLRGNLFMLKEDKKYVRHIKQFVEGHLSKYHELIGEYNLLRQNIILATPQFDGQPRGNSISKSTENKACSLQDNKRLIQLELIIGAIEKVLDSLTEEKRLFVKCKYWDKRFNSEGIAMKFNINSVTSWRWSEVIIAKIAEEMGLVIKK